MHHQLFLVTHKTKENEPIKQVYVAARDMEHVAQQYDGAKCIEFIAEKIMVLNFKDEEI